MLVLTRKAGESIVINDVVKVTVVEIRGDKIRLGIDAPREMDVHRQEVWEAIQVECTSKPGGSEVYNCSDLSCPVHGQRNRNLVK